MLQGVEAIPAREVGYILRSLGQNPTEDEINNLICEAGCDWEVSSVNICIFDVLNEIDRPGSQHKTY